MRDKSSSLKTLRGKTVLVACSPKKISAISDGLGAIGARVVQFPIIEVREMENKAPLDTALNSLNIYDWIVFTSVYGVSCFTHRFHERKISRDCLRDVKICAVGPATARTLKENGFEADLVPARFVAEGVLEALDNFHGGLRHLSGCRFLIPRAEQARDVLQNALEAAGAHVDIIVCYQTVRAELSSEEIRKYIAEDPDLIVFTSSSTVRNSMDALGYIEGKKLLDKTTVAAIGPITADTVESYGKHVEIVPEESTIESLIDAIEQHYSKQ